MKPLLLLVLAVGLCPRLFGATATFTNSADTTISEDGLARADGISGHMIVGHLDPGRANVMSRGLLRFDLSSIPSDAVLTSVTLRVTVLVDASLGTVFDTHVLNRLLADWTETGASWFATGLGGWEEGGGDFDASPDASLSIGPIGYATFPASPSLVAAGQSWVSNAAGNYGWMLRSLSEGDGRNARRFSTREAGTNQPLLTVQYTTAPPPQPPTRALNNLRVLNGNFAFDFTAAPGTNYTVQYKNVVDSTNWTDLVSYPDPGTQTVFTVEHSLTGSNSFYRIVTPPLP